MGKGRDKIKKVVDSYRTDLWFRAEASVYTSCGINLTYSMYQALIGLTRNSAWFDALAIYYILLTASRVLMLFYVRNEAPDGIVELKRYRVCGYMLLALTFMICGLGLLLNNGGSEPKEYPGHMVYVVGTYTIFTLVNSCRNLWNYRKLESPLISASKSFNLAAAFVSLYAFEAAFIAQFRAGLNPSVITLLNVTTAGAAIIAAGWMGGHIVVRSTRALNGREDLYIVVDQAKTGYQKEWRADVRSWINNTGDNIPEWARQMSQYADQYDGTRPEGKKDYRKLENR